MKRLAFIAIALLSAALPAIAQQASYVYTPLGFQQITPVLTGSTLTLPPGTAGGTPVRMAIICAESGAIRWRDDGVTPTTSQGMLLEPVGANNGLCLTYSGALGSISFTPATVTTPSILDVSYYR